MAGTKIGGLKAKAKNLAKNSNFYAEIGAKGGRNGTTGGFAALRFCDCELTSVLGEHHKAQCAGYKGGTISRRKPKNAQEE